MRNSTSMSSTEKVVGARQTDKEIMRVKVMGLEKLMPPILSGVDSNEGSYPSARHDDASEMLLGTKSNSSAAVRHEEVSTLQGNEAAPTRDFLSIASVRGENESNINTPESGGGMSDLAATACAIAAKEFVDSMEFTPSPGLDANEMRQTQPEMASEVDRTSHRDQNNLAHANMTFTQQGAGGGIALAPHHSKLLRLACQSTGSTSYFQYDAAHLPVALSHAPFFRRGTLHASVLATTRHWRFSVFAMSAMRYWPS